MIAANVALTVGDEYFLDGRFYKFLGFGALQEAINQWVIATTAILPLWLILEWVRYYKGPSDHPEEWKRHRGLALDTALVGAYFVMWVWSWLTELPVI